MGYRSTVAYTIRFNAPTHKFIGIGENLTAETIDEDEKVLLQKKAEELFKLFIAEAKSKPELSQAIGDEDLIIDEKKLQINFIAQNIKWYPDYDYVKAHEALIELSQEWANQEDELDGEYRGWSISNFIGGAKSHVGEDVIDADEGIWGEGEYDWVHVSRQVIVDWL